MTESLLQQHKQTIAKAIKDLRLEKGKSQKFFADILGISQAKLSRIEKGILSIEAEKLAYLARLFDLPYDWFFSKKSPQKYSRLDIIAAALSYYGAKELSINRSINVTEHYPDFDKLVIDAIIYCAKEPRLILGLYAAIWIQALKPDFPGWAIYLQLLNDQEKLSIFAMIIYKLLSVQEQLSKLVNKFIDSVNIRAAIKRLQDLSNKDELPKFSTVGLRPLLPSIICNFFTPPEEAIIDFIKRCL